MPATSQDNLPQAGFYFSLSMNGARDTEQASFQEASGISMRPDEEEIQEGGENRFKHKLPGWVKFPNLILKHGIVPGDSALAKWFVSSLEADLSQSIVIKTLTLSLLNKNGDKMMGWSFINAYPVKWSISDLKKQDNMIAIETIEFAYNYYTRNV